MKTVQLVIITAHRSVTQYFNSLLMYILDLYYRIFFSYYKPVHVPSFPLSILACIFIFKNIYCSIFFSSICVNFVLKNYYFFLSNFNIHQMMIFLMMILLVKKVETPVKRMRYVNIFIIIKPFCLQR